MTGVASRTADTSARRLAQSAFVVALLLPIVVRNEYHLQVLTLGFVWAIATSGLNIVLGFAGQLSLAHAGFFGIGAYTVGLLGADHGVSFWLGLPAAVGLSAIAGFAVGSLCLRSKGHYFAIFTLAVGIIIHLVIQKWESLTHGHIGVIAIPGPGTIGPLTFENSTARYYLVLAFLVFAMTVSMRILRSPAGRTLLAARESEALAASVGIDVMRAKRTAFTLSAAMAGLAGALYAGYLGYLGPEAASVEVTFNTLLYLMVGGIGSISGPLTGTFIVYGLAQTLQALEDYQMVVFGPALVLLVIFLPGGLAGAVRRLRRRSHRGPVVGAVEEAW
jgi:branched-chain amino acid transport system permease protein